jgi:hypothetical protein
MTGETADGSPTEKRQCLAKSGQAPIRLNPRKYGAPIIQAMTRSALGRISLDQVRVSIDPVLADGMHAVGPAGNGIGRRSVTGDAFNQYACVALQGDVP